MRLTVAQALVRFLGRQQVERDGEVTPLFAGCLGIFGHGNVAGIGQALLQEELAGDPALPYVLARNEQAMVHTAVAYARARDRRQVWACTASVGPGSTNMLTGAALATVNRIPVLLLPSGTFATRRTGSVLQQLESPVAGDVTVNDAFRPLSRWFDRVSRPEQLPDALLQAMRVLTDPAETGAVTLALPQDVQAEAHDWPDELFDERVWRIPRTPVEPDLLDQAAAEIRSAARPLVVAGGGVHYSGAEEALRLFAAETGIPVAETQAGKGSLLHGDPQLVGAAGSTGTTAANALARDADLVVGVGTRWSDFTTASRTAFQDEGVRFVNLNVTGFDAGKHAGLALVGDARDALEGLRERLSGHRVTTAYADRVDRLRGEWDAVVTRAYAPPEEVTDRLADGMLTQAQVLGAVNELSDPRDVVVCAAGSMPGDLHKLWRVRDAHGYHVEYGFSCMGYEIPGGIGVRWADPSRDVFVLVGDGSYLMLPGELATAVQERTKIVVVIVQNHGFGSIGSLSESLGSQRFGTRYRYRDDAGRLDGEPLPVDLAANAESLGARVLRVRDAAGLADAVRTAKAAPDDGGPVVIHVTTDPLVPAPDSDSWWDVPVSQVSDLDTTRAAYDDYAAARKAQRSLLRPHPTPTTGQGAD
ncbi:3D-(3,5/4)-trihydroxycyclohexane-1,2-dione acylhydrolase (decyclizing) [Barrientosiimonas humi]|uniref:3D-(3,5/4)-trihydroxycyclohexane-1,2-dione acylhydrolase (decyclizing) n=1 Tax=Barrientosiimonas humi TaxID=999931 RepID=UPI00370D6F6E